MAALYGRMQGNRGETTRCGSEVIETKLETWSGAVRVILSRDGSFTVAIGEKYNAREIIATGNVDDRTAYAADGSVILGGNDAS